MRSIWMVLGRAASALTLVTGCDLVLGLNSPDALIRDSDGVIDGASDASPAGCDLGKPFGAPVALSAVNSAGQERHAWLSADGLTIYFSGDRAGTISGLDINYATRASVQEPFGPAMLVSSVNSDSDDQQPVLSPDGLTLYFSSGRTGGGDIYVAVRPTTAAAFGTPSVVVAVNDSIRSDVPTHINADGTTLYLSSIRTGDWDLLRATRAGAGATFSEGAPIIELNVPAVEDYGAVLTGDELTVYFESTRPGTTGCYDIFMATRASVTSGFGTPTPVAELSTPTCEFPTWVSADGCQILLTSNRPGGLGLNDVWLATRPL